MNRYLAALAAATVATIAMLWVAPPVGVIAVVVMLTVLPPWGRSLTERLVVSLVVVLGVVAVLFPRAGTTPVTTTSARLLLAALLLGLLALRAAPALRGVPIPRPTLTDGFALLLGAGGAFWLMAAYLGQSAVSIVSGLYFSGWDNHAHFTTFANTYEAASTTWPTSDGTVAWNQWYPSLHTTVWALLESAWRPVEPLLSRTDLLWPYVQWNAVSFAFCLVALAWVAGDLAARISGRRLARLTAPLAFGAVGLFGLLGSPALLYNAGFTNFMLGVTVAVVASYVSARSLRSARVLGWFLVPLATLAVVGLWTPLALGLVPAGIVVAWALIRYRWWVGAAWLVASAAVGAVMALTQAAAILGVEPGTSTGDFTADLGAVGIGMVPFNIGLALTAPLFAVLAAALLVRTGRWPLAVGVVGPILAPAVVALVFVGGADAAGVSRLQSYYVLKPLFAVLVAAAVLIGALVAVIVGRGLEGLPRVTSGLAVGMAAVVLVGLFGYVGVLGTFSPGYAAAPGVQAAADRSGGVRDSLVGEAIIRAVDAAEPYPERATLLWDGSGTLPNLWTMSLHGVLSKADQRFYKGLPAFPYEAGALDYLDLTLRVNAGLDVAALWFRPSSGELLDTYVAARNDDRVISVQVPMPPNDLCPECAP